MQTRLSSFIESLANTATGFIMAVTIQFIVNWWKHLPLSIVESLSITLIFTVASIIRSYLWRRYFNKRTHHGNRNTEEQTSEGLRLVKGGHGQSPAPLRER